MRLIKGSLGGLVLAGVCAMMPAAAVGHGGGHGGGGGGHGFGGGGGGTLLWVVVVTDSVVVMHLVDSPVVALARDSAGRGGFLLVDFLVAEITATSVIVVSMGEIGTFRGRRFRDFDGVFVDFGFYGFGYPDYYQYDYPYQYYDYDALVRPR